MQSRFQVPLPATAPRACVVCEQPLDLRTALMARKAAAGSAPQLYALCAAFDCRMVFEHGEHLADAEFQQHLRWRAQVAREEKVRGRLRQGHIDAENREAAAVFAALTARRPRAGPPDLRLTVPSGHARLRPLPERRRRKHAEHLDAIIAAALAETEPFAPSTSASPAPSHDLAGRLCGVCGGGCCLSGGEKAYLTPATMRRVMAANPGLSPGELRAIYLDRLPERTIPRSCVHHTRGGCSLPRSVRADVCNTFACAPLKLLQQELDADPPVRKVIVLRRRQNHWNQANPKLDNDIVSATLLTEGASTQLRPPAPEGWMAAAKNATADR
jgi:hypothetical protein